MRPLVVTVLIDLPADHRFYRATVAALKHAGDGRGVPVDIRVVPTDTIRDAAETAGAGSAVIIGPGSPYRDPDAAHGVVRKARELNIPLVGT
jgi:CTP synthase (UTP-ammonia lyase)